MNIKIYGIMIFFLYGFKELFFVHQRRAVQNIIINITETKYKITLHRMSDIVLCDS